MAGLWETWSANGTEITSGAILTTEANDVDGELHDRMPVILDHDEEQRWLAADDEAELQALVDTFPDDRIKTWEVTAQVNNPANEDLTWWSRSDQIRPD